MHVANTVHFPASPSAAFALVQDLERWPALLPHYRFVRVLAREDGRLRVKMSAYRSRIPVTWTSDYVADAATPALHFRHVRGATRGMAVVWHFVPRNDGTDVTIEHDFTAPWTVVGRPAAWLICRVFVQHIAGRTLARFAELARQSAGVPA